MDFLTELGIDEINAGASTGYRWWSSAQGERFASVNPANGEIIAEVVAATVDDYERVMRNAQQAALAWRETPAPKRGDIIRQIGDCLRAHKSALGSLVSLEMGKSKQEGDGEVQEMIDIADFAEGQSRMLYGKTMHSERPEHRMYEQWHPYGVIGVISAFNFPVAVWAWNAFISAICGNITVWKPSASTPLCAIAVQHLCNQVLRANDCPEIFGLVISEHHDVAEKMTADPRLPLISFTGSTQTGRHVAQVVAARLGQTILELGGNNAIIVDESADLNLVLPAIVFGAVGTAGQRCTSTRRVYIHDSQFDAVVDKLTHAYQQLQIGDPLDESNHMGPLINQAAVDQYLGAIEDIRQAGGEILCGGEAIDQPGFYVEPTIVRGLSNKDDIVQHETFAPILYTMAFADINEAINLQNDVKQGLSSALFTNDLRHAELFLSANGSDCGIANINIGTSGAEIGGAFGGEKETGGGRESGSDAWKAYMRRQTNTINWGGELPLAQGIRFQF